jgi:Kef-type K+ transport system membrane component KefB
LSILEVLKQLQALISAALPFLTTKLSLLPFLNPQIAEELWPITCVLALVSSSITYNLSQRFQKPRMGRMLAVLGAAFAVISTVSMLAVVDGLVFSGKPELQDFSVRSMFVLLFVGIGLAIGYASSRFIPQ